MVDSRGSPGRTWPATQKVKVRLAARTNIRNEWFIEFVKGESFVFINNLSVLPID